MGKSKRIAAHIAASILALALIALYGWRANQFLIHHLDVANDWVSNRRIAEFQPLLAILILAGILVRLPHFVDQWLGLTSRDTTLQPRKRQRLRINWVPLLTQGLPAILLMEFPSYLLLIGQAIWRDPFYLVPVEVIFMFVGYGEFVCNSLAAFWLGGTLVDALEFVDYRTADKEGVGMGIK
ncbi:MAG: hypothetical protein H5T62_14315 [Anaerolineae bacterium]|nr:hypothetical protein [Anaerolineae bacterium]